MRVTGQEVKAKWIRIELKKVEMLPGGGQTNSYFDFVGQSPMTLWQSSEEYESLKPVSSLNPCGGREADETSSPAAIARHPIRDPYT